MFSHRLSEHEQSLVHYCISAVLSGQVINAGHQQNCFDDELARLRIMQIKWPQCHGSSDFADIADAIMSMRDASQPVESELREWLLSGAGEYGRLLSRWIAGPNSEREWLEAYDPQPMLEVVQSKADYRKLRLYACACVRRAWQMGAPDRFRLAVETAERYADKLLSEEALLEEESKARSYAINHRDSMALAASLSANVHGTLAPIVDVARFTAREIAALRGKSPPRESERGQYWDDERVWQADLVRHIVGNPFRQQSAPSNWAGDILEVAQQLYDGANVSGDLQSLLLDRRHFEIANHFRQVNWHPKGCWALDLILGK